jgi:GT2 family glycosyltransferase
MAQNSTIRLAFGIPAYGSKIAADHAKMWISMGAALLADHRFEFGAFITMDICGVDKARNFLIAYAMKESCDWLLMIDADTWVSKGSLLLQMIRDADVLGATIVGAPVYRRVETKEQLNAYVWKDGKLVAPYFIGKDMITEVDGIGAAVMAMNLHKIGDASFKFTDELSEDLDFCKQIQMRGGHVYCDLRVDTHHVKTSVMSWPGVPF